MKSTPGSWDRPSPAGGGSPPPRMVPVEWVSPVYRWPLLSPPPTSHGPDLLAEGGGSVLQRWASPPLLAGDSTGVSWMDRSPLDLLLFHHQTGGRGSAALWEGRPPRLLPSPAFWESGPFWTWGQDGRGYGLLRLTVTLHQSILRPGVLSVPDGFLPATGAAALRGLQPRVPPVPGPGWSFSVSHDVYLLNCFLLQSESTGHVPSSSSRTGVKVGSQNGMFEFST